MVAADFNNDGAVDLLMPTNDGYGTTWRSSVFLGNGDGTFQEPVNGPSNLAGGLVGDFNNDGNLDLLGGSSIYLGNGDGTFQFSGSVELPAGQSYNRVAAGDLNDDGNLDLAVTGSTLTQKRVGKPRTCYIGPIFPESGRGRKRGDGWYSYDCSTYSVTQTDYVNVLLGAGDGTFQIASTTALGQSVTIFDTSYESISSRPVDVALGDFNRDGNLDVLTVKLDSTASKAILLPGNGDGTLGLPSAEVAGTGISAVADFNGDSRLDFLTTASAVYLGDGNGAFEPGPVLGLGVQTVGDFNGDGKLDFVNTTSGTVNVYLGNGDATFQGPLHFNAGSQPNDLVAADFNGDGCLDLAVRIDGGIAILLNDGNW
jgi:hypothetical protein